MTHIKRICVLHGTKSSVPVVEAAFAGQPVELYNAVNTEILRRVEPDGTVDRATLRRFASALFDLTEARPDLIVAACNITSRYVPLVRPFFEMPVIAADEPMLISSAAARGKLGVIASRLGCAEACARQIARRSEDKDRDIVPLTVEKAHAALCAGDSGLHDRLIAEGCRRLFEEGCQTVVLSQLTLSAAAGYLAELPARILSIPGELTQYAVRLLNTEKE